MTTAPQDDSLTPDELEAMQAEHRLEMEALLASERALFHAPLVPQPPTDPQADALSALERFVSAANELSRQWGDLDDTAFLDHQYPERLPSFDEFAVELEGWLAAARERLNHK